MPFRLYVSGCNCFLSSSDGHSSCLRSLGREHEEKEFVDGLSYMVYHVLHNLDSASTQTISLLCLRGSGVSAQGPSLWDVPVSPRIFTKVAKAAHSLLKEVGIGILNYLDDWPILAHSRDPLCKHRDMVLRHLGQLGKEQALPCSVLNFLKTFRGKTAVPLE